MKFKFILLLIGVILNAQSALDLINNYRKSAGLNPLSVNPSLACAAKHHALFLNKNRILGHYEKEGYPYFFGVRPSDRAIKCGYQSRYVIENVSNGNKDYKDSIKSLMGAIYHRFGFLDFNIDEIGYAREGDAFVYDMGNSVISKACEGDFGINSGNYGICKEFDKIIPPSLTYKVAHLNPKIVIWPYADMKNVPVTFYNEYPDPLPDYEISGYPVSIQLNPSFYKKVEVKSFKLYQNQKEITSVKILTSSNDPNHLIKPTFIVLFPLKPLKLNSVYEVKARLTADSEEIELQWRFYTETKNNLLINDKKNQTFYIKPDKDYVIFLKPLSSSDVFNSVRVRYRGVKVNTFKLTSANEISLNLSGKGEFVIFAGERKIVLKVK